MSIAFLISTQGLLQYSKLSGEFFICDRIYEIEYLGRPW